MINLTFLDGSMMKTDRTVGTILLASFWKSSSETISYLKAISFFGSAMIGKVNGPPVTSSMSFTQALWLSTSSVERPNNVTFLLANSGANLEKAPSSVVHTGVKSAGWEKRTTHFLLDSMNS